MWGGGGGGGRGIDELSGSMSGVLNKSVSP